MDVGLVGAGILSGVLGAHLVTVLRDRLSAGTWIDSLIGALGGGISGQVVVLMSSGWDETTVGLAIGRIAAVLIAAIVGGAVLLMVTGMLRSSKRNIGDDAEQDAPMQDRRASNSDRRKRERRLSERD